MVKYSYRALYMKYVQGSWIELCNNDCGAMVYFDKESNIVRNAAEDEKNCVHKDVCDFLKDLRKGARAFNWFPSYAIEEALVRLFKAAGEVRISQNELLDSAAILQKVIREQQELNKLAKSDWNEEKRLKLQAKKDTERAYERETEQQTQWKTYGREYGQYWNGKSDGKEQAQVPRFTTADRV
jgi:hypothetical protein